MTHIPDERDIARREHDSNMQDAAFGLSVVVAVAVGILIACLYVAIINHSGA